MKKRVIVVAFVVVGLVIGSWVWLNQGPDRSKYKMVVAEMRDLIMTIQATGVVEPENKVAILPPSSGRIDRIMVEDGSMVHAGQIIAEMSSTSRAALLDIAKTKALADQKALQETYLATPIFAPVSGQIISKMVVAGQTVSQTTTLFEMSDRLIIRAQVDETDVGAIRMQMPAEITVDAYPNKTFSAQVTRIAQQSKTVNNVNVYPVELLLADKVAELRSGMTANINFMIDKKIGVIALPVWAITDKGRAGASVLDKDGNAIPVELGASDGKFTEVTGLSEGFSVYVKPVTFDNHNDAKSPFSPASRGRGRN